MKKNTTKIHHYGIWIIVCLILYHFLPGLLYSILNKDVFIIRYILLGIIVTLIILSIRQHYKIKNNKQILIEYEKQNNAPYMRNISTCVAIYPLLCFLSMFPAGIISRISPTTTHVIIWSVLGLGWLPGLILFIKDQKKLYQYKKEHSNYRENFWYRIIEFVSSYVFINIIIWGAAWAAYDFIQNS